MTTQLAGQRQEPSRRARQSGPDADRVRLTWRKWRARYGWGTTALTPILIIFAVFNLYPLYELARISLRGPGATSSPGVTVSNYDRMFHDPQFWQVLRNTVVFSAVRVPLGLIIGLAVALAIQRTKRFAQLTVFVWFSPFVTSIVAMAVVFTYLYNPNFGLFNTILGWFSIPQQGFLTDPNESLWSILVVDLWKNVGFNVLVFLGGLRAIPADLYEAARVDGATPAQTLRSVTLPLLQRTTYLLLVVGVITSMRVFVPMYVMSGFSLSSGSLGGPLNSTNVLTLDMYQRAFRFGDTGYAAAVAIVLFVLVMLLTITQFRLLKVNWRY